MNICLNYDRVDSFIDLTYRYVLSAKLKVWLTEGPHGHASRPRKRAFPFPLTKMWITSKSQQVEFKRTSNLNEENVCNLTTSMSSADVCFNDPLAVEWHHLCRPVDIKLQLNAAVSRKWPNETCVSWSARQIGWSKCQTDDWKMRPYIQVDSHAKSF